MQFMFFLCTKFMNILNLQYLHILTFELNLYLNVQIKLVPFAHFIICLYLFLLHSSCLVQSPSKKTDRVRQNRLAQYAHQYIYCKSIDGCNTAPLTAVYTGFSINNYCRRFQTVKCVCYLFSKFINIQWFH